MKKFVIVIGGVNLAFGGLYFLHAIFLPTKFFGVPITAFGIIGLVFLCFLHSLLVKGWRHSLIFLFLSFVVTFITEGIGVNHGLWFGDYEYTNALGPKIWGVPILIIICWEGIIYPSHLLVDWLSGLDRKGYRSGPIGGLVMAFLTSVATGMAVTAWDLMADPMAVHLKWWVWDFGGEYFRELHGGVPLSNYWGWFSAVFIISFSYRAIFARSFRYRESFRENKLFLVMLYSTWYFVVGAPLLAMKIALPVFIAAFTMGPFIVTAWAKYVAQRGEA
jgi:uncharacterized membrane protein